MRPGMNPDCRWPAEPTTRLNLQLSGDQRHLRSDIEAAEELGVRYADNAADRGVMSIAGVQVRGRMTSGGVAMARLRDECNVRLFEDIEQAHNVTRADVAAVRATLSNKGADLPVNIPMAALFLMSAFTTSRWLRTRFDSDERAARFVATLMASIFLAGSTTLLGQLWGAAVEMVRLGNEHLSYRLPRLSWRQHFGAVFAIQMIAFWIVMIVDGWMHSERSAAFDSDPGARIG